MWIKNNYRKFKEYMKAAGLFYAFWRGIKYLQFLAKKIFFVGDQKFQQAQNSEISSGKIKIICSACGVHIFWDGYEITKGCGLNLAVDTLGIWTDTAKADWNIVEKGSDYFKVKIVFRELPLSQVWKLRIENENSIIWSIDMEVEEILHIDEFRIVCMLNSRYKSWINNYSQTDFCSLDNDSHDIYMDNVTSSLSGVRFFTEGKFLPAFTIEPLDKSNKSRLPFPLVQNPPLNHDAHFVGFRYIDMAEDKKEYLPGKYHIFRGQISLFKEDYLLDAKMEDIRQDFMQEVIAKKMTKKDKVAKKLKVLLANLPWQKDGMWGVRAGSRWPHIKDASESDYLPFPFFLAYAASLLQKHDIKISIIDAIADHVPENIFMEKIRSMKIDYLVAEISIPSFYYDMKMLEKISQAGIFVIVCGPVSEIQDAKFLKKYPFVKFVLYGEYEFTLLDLINCLQGRKDLSKVQGLIYSDKKGNVIKTPKREPFDINILPWPHRESLPMHKYLDAPGEMRVPSVQMVASRGCPFKCHFCLWPHVIYQGHHYRARDIIDVVDEMEYLVTKKGFKSVYFDDDTFNVGKKRMLEFCSELIERRLDKIQWAIMARPDLMNEEILENMKRAGLWAVKYGVESASQQLIDNIEKCMDIKKSEKMIRYTKKLGINVHLTFTFGLPGETKQTIENTIRYVRHLDPHSVQFSITTPFPGTRYYDILKDKGLIVSEDFSSYDGHYKSVVQFQDLSAHDLELAKERAYKVWINHVKGKRGLRENIGRFRYYLNSKGFNYSLGKTLDYFKYIIFERNQYLNHK